MTLSFLPFLDLSSEAFDELFFPRLEEAGDLFQAKSIQPYLSGKNEREKDRLQPWESMKIWKEQAEE